jgi:hypothetical protein
MGSICASSLLHAATSSANSTWRAMPPLSLGAGSGTPDSTYFTLAQLGIIFAQSERSLEKW